jgi:phage gp16-like protein
MQHTATPDKQLGRKRQRIHALKCSLNLSEEAYRSSLYLITGKHHARDLDYVECLGVVNFFEAQAKPAREVVTDEEALAILG